MVGISSKTSTFLTFILAIIINFNITMQNPERRTEISVRNAEEQRRSDLEHMIRRLEQVTLEGGVVMFAQVVRRINPITGNLLPDDKDHGRHFVGTDELYNQAFNELKLSREYTGLDPKIDDLRPWRIIYTSSVHDRRDVNMVRCRAHPKDFFLKKEDDLNYMIYRETIDA